MPPTENNTASLEENLGAVVKQPGNSSRSDAFLLTLTFLLLLTGLFGVWYFSHPVPDENFENSASYTKQRAGWRTYTNNQYGFEIKYPTRGTEVIVDDSTDPSRIEFGYVNKAENTGRTAFGIFLNKSWDGNTTEKALQENTNFKLMESDSNGGVIYYFSPPTPQTHFEDGPVADAYIISPDKKHVFELSLSQDPGKYSAQKYEFQILSTFKFISTTTLAIPVKNSKGDKIGFIKKISSNNGEISMGFDDIQFFKYTEAVKAAKEDGACEPNGNIDCFIPTGYYMRNKDKTIATYKISLDAKIYVLSDCYNAKEGGIQITPKEFADNFSVNTPCLAPGTSSFYVPSEVPYWIKQDANGKIIYIIEQFIP